MTLKQYQKEYYSLINQMKNNKNNDEYIQIGLQLIYLIKDHPILDKLLAIKKI